MKSRLKNFFKILGTIIALDLEYIINEVPNIIQIITGFLFFGILIKLNATVGDKIYLDQASIDQYTDHVAKYLTICFSVLSGYLWIKFIFFGLGKSQEVIEKFEKKSSLLIIGFAYLILLAAILSILYFLPEILAQMMTEAEITRLTDQIKK